MTPLQRLLQEEIPVRPASATHSAWTQQEQDRHWEDLCHSVGRPGTKRPEHPAPHREDDVSKAAA